MKLPRRILSSPSMKSAEFQRTAFLVFLFAVTVAFG